MDLSGHSDTVVGFESSVPVERSLRASAAVESAVRDRESNPGTGRCDPRVCRVWAPRGVEGGGCRVVGGRLLDGFVALDDDGIGPDLADLVGG
jgi:hypothetical protein